MSLTIIRLAVPLQLIESCVVFRHSLRKKYSEVWYRGIWILDIDLRDGAYVSGCEIKEVLDAGF